jgi:hypothetical protein
MVAKWFHSEEKEGLRNDIINGVVSEETDPKIVYNMRNGAYHRFPYHRFKISLKNLIQAIRKWQNAAVEDEAAFDNAVEQWAHPNAPPYPASWHNSIAKLYLLQDIGSHAIDGMKPIDIQRMRPEYMAYPLKVFRDHLYKERSKPASRAYWEHQRERRLLAKRRRR